MDQGIIYATKLYYRKRVLARLCREMQTINNVSELCKSINVLDAVHWVAAAAGEVTQKSVRGAYRKAGFRFATQTDDTEDNVDVLSQCNSMMASASSPISMADYVSIDSGVHTECDTLDVASVAAAAEQAENDERDEEKESQESQELTQSQPMSSTDFFVSAEQMKQFALKRGNAELYNKIADAVMLFEEEISKKLTKQTTMDDFFKQ